MADSSVTGPRLKFLDTTLYAIVMNIGLRWLAVAAAVGSAAIPLWVIALLIFYVPLACAVSELTERFPGEGSIYGWVRDTQGPLAGFLCGWFYWFALMPFFAGILYYLVRLAASAVGVDTHNTTLYLVLSLVFGTLVIAFQTAGLRYAKWLTNFGATGSWTIFLFVTGVAAFLIFRGTGATNFAHSSYLPKMNFNSAILWGTIIFAFGGAEGLAFVRNDIAGGMRTIRRVVMVLGVSMAVIYIAGTAFMLTILPQAEFTRLGGFPDALQAAFARAGLSSLAGTAIGLLALSQLGGLTAWFAAGAKLPMSAGVDNFLPAVFAKKNEKTGVPMAATLLQGGFMLFMVVLSEAGASAAAAYDFLISMSVLTSSIPYVFVFIAYFRHARRKPVPGAWLPPGGARTGLVLAVVGQAATLMAIICSMVPASSDPHPLATFLKIALSTLAMLAIGLVLYWLGNRRRRAVAAA